MKKIIKKIINVILSLIIITLIGTSTWNKAMCIKEDRNLSEIGTDVNVNGKNIRVSVEGDGNKTIILLSGMGTPEPIVDFKPLSKKLSENYKVVTIEYSGYGLSDDSSKKRNNEVIVEEIRQTLKELQIKPPYVLMPHSISGIYCMQYMEMYPQEIEAMIGIESSVPNQQKYGESLEISKPLYYLVKFMDVTGLSRLSYLNENEFLKDMKDSRSYSDEDIKNVVSMLSRRSLSKASFSENVELNNNCEDLYDVKYPDNIPVLLFLSKDSCRIYKNQNLGTTWEELHEEVISNEKIQKIEYLDGKHYLHWTQSNNIAEMTKEFLENQK